MANDQGQGGTAHKRRKRAGRRRRLRMSPWLIATPVVVAGVVILAVLIVTSGSSQTTGPTAEPTPDARVAEQESTASFAIEAGDDGTGNNSFFTPNTVSAKAGEIIELVVTNTGAVSHNLRVSGPDGEYGTDDDFESQPFAIEPGETVRTAVKIDSPGTYPFRCDFHPALQFGTLVLS
jgi:plastocyanin